MFFNRHVHFLVFSSLFTCDDVTNISKKIQRWGIILYWTKISLFAKCIKNSRISVQRIFLEGEI